MSGRNYSLGSGARNNTDELSQLSKSKSIYVLCCKLIQLTAMKTEKSKKFEKFLEIFKNSKNT